MKRDENGWIKLEDGLPEFGVKVLLLDLGSGYYMIGQRRESEPAFFFLTIGSIHQSCATHWQPLPKLPRSE